VTTLAFAGAGVLVAALMLGAVILLAIRYGRTRQRAADQALSMGIKNEQLQAAVDRPRSRGELCDRLRGGDF
jgi:hypothetical protein